MYIFYLKKHSYFKNSLPTTQWGGGGNPDVEGSCPCICVVDLTYVLAVSYSS